MDEKLQDLVWSILPKDFKKEVKKYYHTLHEQYIDYAGSHLENAKAKVQERIVTLEYFFGIRNLASDAEGEEETLYVGRKQVQEMYSAFEEFKDKDNTCFNLETLFGSKCQPDNVDSLSQNSPENCNNGNLISVDDSKPAEPRFKAGDKAVISQGFEHPIVNDGTKVIILAYHPKGDYYSCAIAPNVGIDVDAKYLEPDTEQTDNLIPPNLGELNSQEADNQSRNLSQDTANCDKELDNILKDSFSKERRLNIAATILAGIMAGGAQARRPVRRALELADALIIESEKGGSDGK